LAAITVKEFQIKLPGAEKLIQIGVAIEDVVDFADDFAF
jgi:hypothetical protein